MKDLDDGTCSSASRRTKAAVMRQRREKVKFRLKGKEVVEGAGVVLFHFFRIDVFGTSWSPKSWSLNDPPSYQSFGHQLIPQNVDTYVLLTSEF